MAAVFSIMGDHLTYAAIGVSVSALCRTRGILAGKARRSRWLVLEFFVALAWLGADAPTTWGRWCAAFVGVCASIMLVTWAWRHAGRRRVARPAVVQVTRVRERS
jgi:hypothetical protein